MTELSNYISIFEAIIQSKDDSDIQIQSLLYIAEGISLKPLDPYSNRPLLFLFDQIISPNMKRQQLALICLRQLLTLKDESKEWFFDNQRLIDFKQWVVQSD